MGPPRGTGKPLWIHKNRCKPYDNVAAWIYPASDDNSGRLTLMSLPSASHEITAIDRRKGICSPRQMYAPASADGTRGKSNSRSR